MSTIILLLVDFLTNSRAPTSIEPAGHVSFPFRIRRVNMSLFCR